MFFFFFLPQEIQTSWRNWIARWTSNPTVAGSNPVEVGFFFVNLEARLAQLAARRSHNPKVVGSIPTLCTGPKRKKIFFVPRALLAQSVALRSYVPAVQGSTP